MTRPHDRIPGLVVVTAAVLFCVEAWSLHGKVGSDFAIFWHAARRFLEGGGALYDPASAATLQGFIYPPPAILALAPLGWMPIEIAAAVFGVVQIVALGWALWAWTGLAGAMRRMPRMALVAVALASGPVFSLRLGQIDGLVLASAIASVALMMRGRSGWAAAGAGAVIAAGCWVKIYPVLLLAPLMLGRDRWRGLAGFAAAAILVPVVTLAFVPVADFRMYFETLLPGMAGGTIVNIYNQSLPAVLARGSIAHDVALTTYAVAAVPAFVRAACYAAALAGIGAIAWRTRGDRVTVAAWCLATIPLIAPLGWGHGYVYSLPLAMLVIARGIDERRYGVVACGAAAFALWIVPAHHCFGFADALPEVAWQLVYARYAVGTLVAMAGAGRGTWRPSRRR